MGAFLSKVALEMESVYIGEYMKKPWCLQPIVFWVFLCVRKILPFLFEIPMCWFSLLVQPRHCHAQSAISWKGTRLKVLQAKECPCTKPGLWGKKGQLWILCPKYRWNLAVQKARVNFLIIVTMGLVWVQVFDDTVERGNSQILVCVFFVKWCFCPGCTNYLCADFPWYGKVEILLPNQASPQGRSILECH